MTAFPMASPSACPWCSGQRLSVLDMPELSFLLAINDMRAGERPIDADYLIQLADLVLDAHKHCSDGRLVRARNAPTA